MRRYVVVAHRTLGGEHLIDELCRRRAADPSCTFHLIVPEYHASKTGWDDAVVHAVRRPQLAPRRHPVPARGRARRPLGASDSLPTARGRLTAERSPAGSSAGTTSADYMQALSNPPDTFRRFTDR